MKNRVWFKKGIIQFSDENKDFYFWNSNLNITNQDSICKTDITGEGMKFYKDSSRFEGTFEEG